MKIMVVDDEKSIRNTISEFLNRDGYVVETAEDGNAALKLLEKEYFDIIITDIIMPRISGIELLKRIYKLYEDIQVIIITGMPRLDIAIQAIKENAFDFLIKPIKKDDLLNIIRHAVYMKAFLKIKQYLDFNIQVVNQRKNNIQYKIFEKAVSSIFALFELHDTYSAGHQRRVGNLAAEIAKMLGFSNNEINLIRFTGYIHDIGKLKIPSVILNKPSALNILERQLVQIHSYCGYKLTKVLDLPSRVSEIVLEHHERLDGSGYPRGIRGEKIRYETNILMIADIAEAMLSSRPYRKPYSLNETLAEIKKNADVHYKKEVSEACIYLLQNGYQLEDCYVLNINPDSECFFNK